MSSTKSPDHEDCSGLPAAVLWRLKREGAQLAELLAEASRETKAPFTFVSALVEYKLIHVARHNIELCDVDYNISFLRFVVSDGLLINDTLQDWRFRYHPLVQSFPNIRSYAAQPLVVDDCIVGSISAAALSPNHFDQPAMGKLLECAGAVEVIISEAA